jgi:hypothetical protein
MGPLPRPADDPGAELHFCNTRLVIRLYARGMTRYFAEWGENLGGLCLLRKGLQNVLGVHRLDEACGGARLFRKPLILRTL